MSLYFQRDEKDMATVDLFAIGNALIDQEFKVSDDFLIQQHLQKALCS